MMHSDLDRYFYDGGLGWTHLVTFGLIVLGIFLLVVWDHRPKL